MSTRRARGAVRWLGGASLGLAITAQLVTGAAVLALGFVTVLLPVNGVIALCTWNRLGRLRSAMLAALLLGCAALAVLVAIPGRLAPMV